jgi:hypothetical protein
MGAVTNSAKAQRHVVATMGDLEPEGADSEDVASEL